MGQARGGRRRGHHCPAAQLLHFFCFLQRGHAGKYIFPGGYIPSLFEVVSHLERHKLYVTDIEMLRLHYAKTLRHWFNRFMSNRDKVKALDDERLCKMWEFYLVGAELSFRHLLMNNFQIQFCLDQNTLPLTRDYVIAEEARLRAIETKSKYYSAENMGTISRLVAAQRRNNNSLLRASASNLLV